MKRTFFRNSIIFSVLIIIVVSFISIGYAAITKELSISTNFTLVTESMLKDRVISTDIENVKFLGCENIDAFLITELYFVGTQRTTYDAQCDASANGDGSVIAYFVKNNSGSGDETGKVYVWGKNGVVFTNAHTHFSSLVNCNTINFKENGKLRFSTKHLTDMHRMFYSLCSDSSCHMNMFDISSFDTSNVTAMDEAFADSGFTAINLGSIDTSNVTNMNKLFLNNISLTHVYVNTEWTTASVTSGEAMFENTLLYNSHPYARCHNTATDSYTYAKIDGGSSSPGCFDYVGTMP